MKLLRSVTTNTVFQILARLISSGSSFLITLFVARQFGVNGYGELAKITTFVSFFYLFVDFGFNAIFLQMENVSSRFRDLFYLRLFMSVGLVVIVSVLGAALPYSSVSHIGYSPIVKLGILLFSVTLVTEGILYSATALFQKKLAYKNQALSAAWGAVVSLLLVGLVFFLSLPLLFIVLAFVLGGVVESLVALFLTKEAIAPLSIDTKFVKSLAVQTAPITLMLLLNLVYFRVDGFLLALMKSTRDVGIYDLAYKFFDFLIALPLFLSNSMYPHLLASEKNSRTPMAKVALYALVFFGLGLLLIIPVWFATPLLIFIKKDFLSSSLPLRILLLSLPVFFTTSILQWVLIAKKQQKFLLFVYAISLIANIILNIIFIPHYSYVASAIITDISEVFVLVLTFSYIILRRKSL
ncbi:MAG TPA: oligosaccharide flippase family protein [Candidatus Saccharimonadales bacterium]|nr:oligosaccharide flippase family protein [Candidatus Saccharimonadales bacterium]